MLNCKKYYILIPIVLIFFKSPFGKKLSLFQIMAWLPTGAKPLSEPMMMKKTLLTLLYAKNVDHFVWTSMC